MQHLRKLSHHRTAFLLLLAAGACLAGCQKQPDEIREYTVKLTGPREKPKDPDSDPRTKPPFATGGMKPNPGGSMLGVLIPLPDKTAWSFKVSGTKDTIEAFAPRLREFVQNVKFADGQPVWKLPDGWRQEAGSGLRFATLKIADNQPPLEIAVNQFTVTPNFIPDNLNRWRDQVGLASLPAADLEKELEVLTLADDVKATFVALLGKPPAEPTPSAPDAKPVKEESIMLAALIPINGNEAWSLKVIGPSATMEKFQSSFNDFVKTVKFADGKPVLTMPDGWKLELASGLRYATLKVANTDPPLEIAVNQFSLANNFLVSNVNRWRGQMGLPELSDNDVPKEIIEVQLADKIKARMVKIRGTLSAPPMGPK